MTRERSPTQRELLEGAVDTIERILVPELQSVWARSSAMGLVGQLRYALARSEGDSLAGQDVELEACTRALVDEFDVLADVLAPLSESGDPSWDLRERAGRLLVFALEEEGEAAVAVRARLRPLLVAHVSQDLGETGPMLQAFLASGSLGSTG